MKRILYNLIICFSALTVSAQSENRIEGEIIVQLFAGATIESVIQDINSTNDFIPESIHALSVRLNIWLIKFDPAHINPEDLSGRFNRHTSVANVQFNHTIQYRVTPDDPEYLAQWNMFNDGTGGGILDADIDAAEAWDLATGGVTNLGDTIVIAIVDDGFFLNHEDLSFFKNYDEIPDNLIDDDGNGYVDDFDGWNSTDMNGTIPSFNHGTHVSGIAGAIGNNGIGVAGVNWNVKILPVRCQVIESQVITSYAYVYDMRELYDATNGEKGAFIVSTNSSFGIDFVFPEDYPVWCAMYDSLGQLGILSAAATNNSLTNIDVVGDMPTGCTSDHLISVTSTDKADNLKAAYGPVNIDLGAPGSLIQSTFPGNTYGLQTGTSMASPHVAGVVALMFSAACNKFMLDYKFDPPSMALLIKNSILNSVDFVEDLSGVCVSSGRLNAYQAINELLTGYCELGIDGNNQQQNDFLIFPNPADQFIYVNIVNDQQNKYQIKIADETGRIIYLYTDADLQFLESGIPAANFADGFYFMQITDADQNQFYSSGFVIQH